MPGHSQEEDDTIEKLRIYEKPADLYSNYQPIYHPLSHVKRVTVCFGSTKIVVPCKTFFTVQDLADGALARYKRATGKLHSNRLRIVRLECMSDGGVLDLEDRLDDVFDYAYDQILAIYDDGNGVAQGGCGMNTSADYAMPMSLAARQRARQEEQQQQQQNRQEQHFVHSAVRSSSSSAYSSNAPLASPYATSPLHVSCGSSSGGRTTIGDAPYNNNGESGSSLERPSIKMVTASVIHDRGRREWKSEEQNYSGYSEHRQPGVVVDAKSGTVTTTANLNQSRNQSLHHTSSSSLSNMSANKSSMKPMRSSLRSQTMTEAKTPPPKPHRVTMSPEVEKRLKEKDTDGGGSSPTFKRGSDRKSRLTDAFFDARERLAEQLDETSTSEVESKTVPLSKPLPIAKKPKGAVRRGTNANTSIVTLAYHEEENQTVEDADMGIEVAAVYDEPEKQPVAGTNIAQPSSNSSSNKLTAVQILRIEKGGRVDRDGRLRVGDTIVEIDGRPVYQMSILRARAHLFDLGLARRDINLTVGRSVDSFLEQEAEANAANDKKPILSALQQANSMSIGETTVIELMKGPNGFGFTVTGRETAKSERLFYIGAVKPFGTAIGHLKSGDRLLEVNGQPVGGMVQLEIVDILKKAPVGSTVKFLISRVPTTPARGDDENKENANLATTTTTTTTTPTPERKVQDVAASEKTEIPNREEQPSPEASKRFDLIIPLNDTGSAGLGISLKARVSVKRDGKRNDCGIFIKNIMHGGAAFKDGQLMVNDRIIGIEDEDLEKMPNGEAGEAISKKLKSIGANYSHVRLKILRESSDTMENGESRPSRLNRETSRLSVDAPSPAPSSLMSQSVMYSPATSGGRGHTASSEGTSSAAHSRQSSDQAASDQKPQLDDSDFPPPAIDPFDREAPTRKSLSEKRGLGAPNDPQRIRLFQNIKHQRQTSAPPSTSSLVSGVKGRSRSQPRFASHRGAAATIAGREEREVGVEVTRSEVKTPDMQFNASGLDPNDPILASGGLLNRKSMSMESINRTVGGAVLRSVEPPNSLVPSMPPVGIAADSHPYPPGSPVVLRRPKSVEQRAGRDKTRRKSVGSMMKNIFGFGSKSREASPEKTSWELRKGSLKERTRREASLDPTLMRHERFIHNDDYAEPYRYHEYGIIDHGDSYYLPQQSPRAHLARPYTVYEETDALVLGNSTFYGSIRSHKQQRDVVEKTTPSTMTTKWTDTGGTKRTDTKEDQPPPTKSPTMALVDQQTPQKDKSSQRGPSLRRQPTSASQSWQDRTTEEASAQRPVGLSVGDYVTPTYHRASPTTVVSTRPVTTPSSPPVHHPSSVEQRHHSYGDARRLDTQTSLHLHHPHHRQEQQQQQQKPTQTTIAPSTRGSRSMEARRELEQTTGRQYVSPQPPQPSEVRVQPYDPHRQPPTTTKPAAVRRRQSMQLLEPTDVYAFPEGPQGSPVTPRRSTNYHTSITNSSSSNTSTSTSTIINSRIQPVQQRYPVTSKNGNNNNNFVFPTTRFAFAPAMHSTYSHTANRHDPHTERLSLRARKKLRRKEVTQSEFYERPPDVTLTHRPSPPVSNVVSYPRVAPPLSPRHDLRAQAMREFEQPAVAAQVVRREIPIRRSATTNGSSRSQYVQRL